jgi:hypothetical protein
MTTSKSQRWRRIKIENGYVTLFKGNIRLNTGKYGKLESAEEPLSVEVNQENNVSSKHTNQERRPFRGGAAEAVDAASVAADVIDVVAAVSAETDAAEIEEALAAIDQDIKLLL